MKNIFLKKISSWDEAKWRIKLFLLFRTWWTIWKIPFQTKNTSPDSSALYTKLHGLKKMNTLNREISIVQEFVMGLLLLLLLLKETESIWQEITLLWILIY